jgi:hypothetical protein
MKRIILPALLLLCTLCACEKEDVPPSYPTTRFSKIEITDTLRVQLQSPRTLYVRVTNETNSFEGGRLINRTIRTQYEDADSYGISTYDVTYSDHQAVIEVYTTPDHRETETYTLNDQGYAIHCTEKTTRETIEYSFSYIEINGKTYLKEVHDLTYGEDCYFDYETPYTVTITWNLNSDTQTHAIASAPQQIPNISAIKHPLLIGPLAGFQTAIQGKLLGEHYPYLLTHVIYDRGTPSSSSIEGIYLYETDQRGIVTKRTDLIHTQQPVYHYTIQ